MPLITVCTNVVVPVEAKRAVATVLTDLFSSTLKTSPAHTHVVITDGQFLCFGGNVESPAACVTIKAADNSIHKDSRKALVAGISQALPRHVLCLGADRIYMTFEDLPVQNFAVGDSIMTFDTMHTAKSVENFAEIAP